MKNRRRKIRYPSLQSVSIIFVFCYIWIWAFYTTQPAIEQNTYMCKEQIVDVKIYDPPSGGGYDEVHLISKKQYFVLETNWYDNDKTQEFINRIISEKQPLTLMIWEHFALTPFGIRNGKWKIHQVVDLRSETCDYWDIESFNHRQKEDRIVAITMSIICSPVLIWAWFPFETIEKYKKKIRKYKKKQKKAKRAGKEKGV